MKKTRAVAKKAKKTPGKKRAAAGSRTARAKSKAKPLSRQLREQAVSKKAYELFTRRGYAHGQDQQDWYAAERLVGAGK